MNTPLTPALAAERDAVEAVARSARAQIDALRTGSADAFQDAAARTFDSVAALDRAQVADRTRRGASRSRTRPARSSTRLLTMPARRATISSSRSTMPPPSGATSSARGST